MSKKSSKDTYLEWRSIIHNFVKELNEDVLEEKNNKITSLREELLNVYINETIKLKNILIDKEELNGKLYKKFKYEDNRQWSTKGEIETQINSDEDFCKKSKECAQQEILVKHYEELLKILIDFKFSIKTTLDILKFKSGYL